MNLKAIIHQPYFLPWMGYFSKLVFAEKFIVLDNVQFSKRHFIDRTRVVSTSGEIIWLGLNTGENFGSLISDVKVKDKSISEKIIKTLKAAYSRARYFNSHIHVIETIVRDGINNSDLLLEIDLFIIVETMKLLKIKMPQIIMASKFNTISDATDRIISLMKSERCNTLILGSGGSKNKHNISQIVDSGIDIEVQDFFGQHPEYYQTRRTRLGFEKGLSIVDCIFNEGLDVTRRLLNQSTPTPYDPHKNFRRD